MSGPVPKDRAQRRRRNMPARGEWVDLPPLAAPVLPDLPARGRGAGAWSARTRRLWTAWRRDRVTGQFGEADVAAAVELAFLFESYVRGEERWKSVEGLMDRLGLTPKGRRDLRWRNAAEQGPPGEVVPLQARQARRLRAVDPAG